MKIFITIEYKKDIEDLKLYDIKAGDLKSIVIRDIAGTKITEFFNIGNRGWPYDFTIQQYEYIEHMINTILLAMESCKKSEQTK